MCAGRWRSSGYGTITDARFLTLQPCRNGQGGAVPRAQPDNIPDKSRNTVMNSAKAAETADHPLR
jgi:hypothetical protein